MAVRTISTRLAIEGEAKYRASLSGINSELKALQSALKLTQSEYAGNANSMAALTAKGEALNRLHEVQTKKVQELQAALQNAQGAVTAYQQKGDSLRTTLEANTKSLSAMSDASKTAGKEWAEQAKIVSSAEAQLKKLQKSSDDTSAAQAKLREKIDAAKAKMVELEKQTGGTAKTAGELILENERLNKELSENEKYLDAAQKGTNEWESRLNSAKIELNNLDAELQKNDKYLDEAAKSADGCAESIDEFGEETDDSADSVDELSQALAAAGIAAILKKIADAFDECVDSSIQYESAMAGVAKTTDMTGAELEAMGDSIKQLATKIPLAATELAGIAEVAGQLGVAKDDLLSFTMVMANLGVATNMTSEEAATMLAQFTAVTGMDASFYENLGSAVVALGNNFATNERKIVDMTQNIAAAGTNANMTEAEMLALSAAVTSVGIEAENGGTQMSKLINEMKTAVETGKGLDDWAAAAGMSAQEFSRLWGEDATAAIAAFIGNLNHMDESATVVLSSLGITETRMVNMISALANAEDKTGLLTRAIQTSNTAWKENTALVKEASTRYETTESRLQLLKNNFENVEIAVGDQLTPALGGLYDIGAKVLGWIAETIDKCEWLVPAIIAVVTALSVFAAGVAVATVATTALGAAIKAATIAMATNPIFLIITALAALTAALVVAISNIDDTVASVEELTTAARECDAAFADAEDTYNESAASYKGNAELARAYAEKLKELEAQGLKTEEAQSEYAMTVDLLRDLIPELNVTIDEQTGLLDEGTDAIFAQIDAWEKLALSKALQEKYQTELEAYNNVLAEQYTNKAKLIEAEEKHGVLQSEYNRLVDEYCAIGQEMMDIYDDTTISAQEQSMAIGELEQQQFALDDQIRTVMRDTRENENLQKNLNKAIDEGAETIVEYQKPLDDARMAMELYAREQGIAAETTNQATEAANQAAESISLALGALAQAYKDAYDSARESLDGQIGLWDKMDNEAQTSAETLQETVDSQIVYLQNYQQNMESLLSRNIEGIREFAANFTDGSAESAAALAGLASATDTEIAAIISSMSQVDQYKESLATIFAELDVDLQGSLDSLSQNYANTIAEITGATGTIDFSPFITAVETAFAGVGVTFETAGANAGEGLAAGIQASRGGAETASTEMAQAVIDATRTALDSHSPSQVMREIGVGVPEGMGDGIDEGTPDLTSTINTLCETIVTTFEQVGKDTVEKFKTEFANITGETQSILDELQLAIPTSTSGMPGEMESVGQSMVDGMISGLNSRSSSLYSTISGLVSNAIAAARTAADSHSPSKKTVALFEDIDEGMIVGAKNKAALVEQAIQDVVNQALDFDTTRLVPSIIDQIDDTLPTVQSGVQSTDNSRHVSIGDIYVTIEGGNGTAEDASDTGEAVADEVERKLRYRGIL